MPLQINITELEEALSVLLQRLREAEGEQIDLEPVDYYWSIPPDALYDPYCQPAELTLGQLTDDLEEMKRLASGDAQPVSPDLAKLSAILTLLGHKTVW